MLVSAGYRRETYLFHELPLSSHLAFNTKLMMTSSPQILMGCATVYLLSDLNPILVQLYLNKNVYDADASLIFQISAHFFLQWQGER